MSPKLLFSLRSAYSCLGERFSRGGTDLGAAMVRMLLSLAVLIYLLVEEHFGQFTSPGEHVIVTLAGLYFIYAALQWISNIIRPGPVLIRRVVSIVADCSIITAAMILAGETTSAFYGGFLWATIANGLRFGRFFLITTNICSVLGFSLVLIISSYWQNHLPLGIGLMVWLILLPGYVATLLKRLEAALQKANKANNAKSDFLANMSHELRTPLNVIIGYSELLQEEALDASNKQAHEDLVKIQYSANHLLGLINGILDLSKIESGKVVIEMEWFDVRKFVLDIVNAMLPLMHKRGNRCETEFHMCDGRILTDKVKLKQIIINLLGNANKFTEAGEIRISVACNRDDHAPSMVVKIEDTGIGIPDDKLKKIFEPFMQADNSSTRKFEGTGLGLTITKHFVQVLGGEISVSSQAGVGSQFTVKLPDVQYAASDLMQQKSSNGLPQKIAV